jgi:hypothetical protein
MDAKTIREQNIRPKLEEVFGKAIANALITASIAAGMGGKTESEKLELMVESICSDPKVVTMWGAAQIGTYKQEWMSTLK